MAVLTLFITVTPSVTMAATDFESVPEDNEGYVPETDPEKPAEDEHPAEDDHGMITGIMINLLATVIDVLAEAIEWMFAGTDLQSVLFGSVNPLTGEEFGSSSVGHIFSAAEWNYAVNPLRIAFSFGAWILFVVMIAHYGIKLMKESTNPIQRSHLIENIYAWIGGAAMLVFMYIVVFIIFNLNYAIVDGLRQLTDNEVFGDVFSVLDQSWDDKSLTGNSFGDAFLHLGLAIMTLVLLIHYIFRKFIIGFLVVISPLAAVAYARDKDGEVFKLWLSELLSQTFIQSAHAVVVVLYLAFVNASNNGTSIFNLDNLGVVGNSMQSVVDPILSFLIAIGGVVAVGALTYNGLRLSFSSGNPMARAHAIKGIRTSIIGCLICIGAVVIVNVLRGLMF
ncbi:Mbov_0395 family pilin-like conjugal transfer protein [Lentibacillus salinarum]|uniref:Mbov_0395 family pilin-like conjugal transfer protein n=2 Tax=Lentibacillus salinarum TaxID=446820 RepID=A0ABW3ZX47_9BACI